ncbi:MAG: hypothetical protein ACRDP8_22515, partial [Actinopolymorphaceae bacterium]
GRSRSRHRRQWVFWQLLDPSPAFVGGTSRSSWGQLLAMSFISLLPILGFFVAFQKLLLEGISTTGIKG